MAINLEEIYDQYRKADFTGRLSIYLQFPELRDDFLEIEQTEGPLDFFETTKPLPQGTPIENVLAIIEEFVKVSEYDFS